MQINGYVTIDCFAKGDCGENLVVAGRALLLAEPRLLRFLDQRDRPSGGASYRFRQRLGRRARGGDEE